MRVSLIAKINGFLPVYVSRTRERLRKAGTMAREALSLSQKKMKRCFDQKAVLRNFLPGEKVLVLIPIPGSALTARFSGSYMIKSKYDTVNDSGCDSVTELTERVSLLSHTCL